MKSFFWLGGLILLLIGCQTTPPIQMADLVILNGQIATMDDQHPTAEAVAVQDGKILKIGSNEDIKPYIEEGKTKVIDAKGSFVMPGFIDGHAHFAALGGSLMRLNLLKSKNWSEIIGQVKETIGNSNKNEWIIGRGWHQEKWDTAPTETVGGYPTHTSMSATTPENPVMLNHASGHALFANQKAMELAGITAATPNPEGGNIVRDAKGNPTGIFEETAMELIQKAYDDYLSKRTEAEVLAEWHRQIELATAACLRNGITSFQDAGSTFEEIERYQKLASDGKMGVRLWAMIGADQPINDTTLRGFPMVDMGEGFFTVRAIKGYSDGALGSHGAWLLQPYNDKENYTGLNVTPMEDLRRNAEFAAQYGLQMCIHAIGDRANREVLDMYAAVFQQTPAKKDWRWRIEHAQHVNLTDIPRFAQLGVIPSMQAIHCTSDAPYVPKRLGNFRAKMEAYAWRTFLNNGSMIVNGTDAPVEEVNPIPCFYASVTRKIPQTGDIFYPEQVMTRLEALKSYTINNAVGAFEEGQKGSLTIGKVADIVILSNNLLSCSDDAILETKVLYTIVGGKVHDFNQ